MLFMFMFGLAMFSIIGVCICVSLCRFSDARFGLFSLVLQRAIDEGNKAYAKAAAEKRSRRKKK